MPKHFKLKFPRVIPLIQCCRPKHRATLPAIYRLSPINAKAVDIGYPKLLPAPPPSTPEHPAAKRRLSSKTAKSIGCGSFRTRSCAQYFADCSMEMKSSPISETEKYYRKKRKEEKKKKKTKPARAELLSMTTSSGNHGNWFSGEFEYDEGNEESGTPIYSSGSFSNEFSLVLESIGEKMAERQSALQKQNRKKASSAKPMASCGGGGEVGKIKAVLMPIRVCRGNAGKVRESVAVVKKSEDPYEDFKRSMIEMIMEKQIFEVKELEELLHCFLTLNSRHYQGVIVEAFSEIWELLFSSDPSDHHLAGKKQSGSVQDVR